MLRFIQWLNRPFGFLPLAAMLANGEAWYLYYEQYPGVAYGVSVCFQLEGPWYQLSGGTSVLDWNKFEMTPKARHGSMRPISRKEYDALVANFGA